MGRYILKLNKKSKAFKKNICKENKKKGVVVFWETRSEEKVLIVLDSDRNDNHDLEKEYKLGDYYC